MKVVEGNFKQEVEEPSAAKALEYFAALCADLEDKGVRCEVSLVVVSDLGVTVGGTAQGHAEANYMLDLGKQSLIDAAFMADEGEYDEDPTTTH